jgi:hypothetical protein
VGIERILGEFIIGNRIYRAVQFYNCFVIDCFDPEVADKFIPVRLIYGAKSHALKDLAKIVNSFADSCSQLDIEFKPLISSKGIVKPYDVTSYYQVEEVALLE